MARRRGRINSMNSLVGKTKIKTIEGTKLLKDIQVGDKVFGIRDNQVVFSTVMKVFKSRIKYSNIGRIVTNKSKILGSKHHLIWVEGRQWKRLDSIEPNEKLKSIDGIDTVAEVKLDYAKKQNIDVYSLETDTENFFANDILVKS